MQPLVAVVAERDRPRAHRRPDPAPDRLQAEAVLVLGPDLDRPVRMRGRRLARPPRPTFFERLPVLGRRRARMARPRRLDRPRRAASALPSRAADAPSPGRDAAPSRRRPWGRSTTRRPRAAPAAARPRRPAASGVSRLAVRPFRRRWSPSASGPKRVVARRQLLHPARHEGQHLGHLEQGPPLRQQPDRLVVPRLRRIPRRPVARLQLLSRQVLDNPRHDPNSEPWPLSLSPPRPPGIPKPAEAISRIPYHIVCVLVPQSLDNPFVMGRT